MPFVQDNNSKFNFPTHLEPQRYLLEPLIDHLVEENLKGLFGIHWYTDSKTSDVDRLKFVPNIKTQDSLNHRRN